jgi:hypothetical protein
MPHTSAVCAQVWYGRGAVGHNALSDQEGGRARHSARTVRQQDRLLRRHSREARQVGLSGEARRFFRRNSSGRSLRRSSPGRSFRRSLPGTGRSSRRSSKGKSFRRSSPPLLVLSGEAHLVALSGEVRLVGLSGEARQAGLSGEAQQKTIFFNSGNMVIDIFVRFATSESGGMFPSALRNFTFFSFIVTLRLKYCIWESQRILIKSSRKLGDKWSTFRKFSYLKSSKVKVKKGLLGRVFPDNMKVSVRVKQNTILCTRSLL